MKHRVAVIGAGTMGRVHAGAYSTMDNVELVGVVDTREEAGKPLASRYHARWFSDCDSMIEAAAPNVVDICLPTYLHAEYAIAMAEKGVHVVCEKPIARTLSQARQMIDACDSGKVRLFVAHVVRFFPAYETARRLIQSGEIGAPGTVFAMRGGAYPTGWDDWYADYDRSGSLVVDLMIHDFDFLRWSLGEVKRVYARSLQRGVEERIDHAFVSLRFANGAIGSVEGTWAYPEGFRTSFEFAGREGTIVHDSEAERPLATYLRATPSGAPAVALPESPLAKSPYQRELEHFLDCLESGEEPKVTAEDAYRALEISLAATESAATGSAVELGSPTANESS